MSDISLSEKRARAGQMGGISTVLSHPPGYMRELGRRGGLKHGGYLGDDALQARAEKISKEAGLPDSNSLPVLLRAWKQRRMSSAIA